MLEQGLVVEGGERATGREGARQVRPEGAGARGRDLLEVQQRRGPGRLGAGGDGPVRQHVAEADPGHVARGEVVEPGAQHRGPGLVAVGDAAVARPRLGVLRGILAVALDHPDVEARLLEPAPGVRGPVLAIGGIGGGVVALDVRGRGIRGHSMRGRGDLPVREHDRAAARCQVRGQLPGDVGEQLVTAAAAVPVRPLGDAGVARGDDERRVGDDEVELLARDRLEQRSRAQIQVDPVERRGEGRERDRALGQVGGDHPIGVAGGVQGLDAAATAHIERRAHALARRDRREGERCPADPEHVLGVQGRAGGELGEVRGDPPADRAQIVLRRVGGEVDERTDALAVEGDDAQLARAVGAGGRERGVQHAGIELVPEGEQLEQARGRVVDVGEGAQRRHRLLAAERGGGHRAQQILDALARVLRPLEVLAQGGDAGGDDARGSAGRGSWHDYDCAAVARTRPVRCGGGI